MNNFLKQILKSGNSVVETDPSFILPIITNPVITYNNGCETMFEGSFIIPTGFGISGILTGTLIQGSLGVYQAGNNGALPLIGSENILEGEGVYAINLGNSGIPNENTKYSLHLLMSNGQSKTIIIERTVIQSAFYDTVPCSDRPYLLTNTIREDSCESSVSIFVPVPIGESRHITITYVNYPLGVDIEVDITVDTVYTLKIEREIDSNESNNIEFSLADIGVSLTNTSNTFFSHGITRQHKGTAC